MRQDLTVLFSCPLCDTRIGVAGVDRYFEIEGRRHVVDGMLGCERAHRFPIRDEIPRLVTSAQTAETKKTSNVPTRPKRVQPAIIDSAQVSRRLRILHESRYGISEESDTARRAMSESALSAALPFATGFGMETGMTIDVARAGYRIQEIELPLSHRATGKSWSGFIHRGRQLIHIALAYWRR